LLENTFYCIEHKILRTFFEERKRERQRERERRSCQVIQPQYKRICSPSRTHKLCSLSRTPEMCSLSRTYSISRQVIQALNPKPHRDTHTHTHTLWQTWWSWAATGCAAARCSACSPAPATASIPRHTTLYVVNFI
jgi:hypothetical protein